MLDKRATFHHLFFGGGGGGMYYVDCAMFEVNLLSIFPQFDKTLEQNLNVETVSMNIITEIVFCHPSSGHLCAQTRMSQQRGDRP